MARQRIVGVADSNVGVPAPGRHSAKRFSSTQIALLLVITLLAAVLRLFRLGDWSLWVDEANTWRDVTMPLWGDGGFFSGYRGWYPLSFLLLRSLLDHGLLPMWSEGWLRLPFACCGILTVPALAVFGNLLVGRRAALLSALFLAVNPWHIYWSQNIRGYVLVFFFAIVAAGVFWLGALRGSWRLRLLGLLTAVVGGLCHPTAYLLLAPFVVYTVLVRQDARHGARFWLQLAVIGAIATLAARLLVELPQLQTFARAKPDASLTHLLQTIAFYFRLPLLITALTGMWLLFLTRMQGRILFLACWALVPLAVLAVLGASVMKVTARYGFCALPPVMLLAGAASVRIGRALVQGLGHGVRWGTVLPAVILPTILCLDMVSYDILYFTSQHGDRGMWREAARYVVDQTPADKKLSVYTVNEPTMMYYLRPMHYADRSAGVDPYPDREVVGIESWEVTKAIAGSGVRQDGNGYFGAAIERTRREGKELFVVITRAELEEKDADGTLRAALQERFELVAVLPVWVGPKDESIYVYRAAS